MPTEWRPLTRLAFRFAFCYLALYCLIVLGNVIEFLPYEQLWRPVVPWVGQHVLHLSKPITYFPSGSGDKTSDWVLLLCHLAIAIVAAVVWSLLDRRKEYTRLNQWLRLLLRYSLIATMFAYGSAKVVKLQFADPSLARLLEPLRDISPMGLLWTFMGFSTPYTFFAGACELLGGVLLAFRRTTTLGALVTAAVMVNVAMLNYAYDTPVKLLSTHLVLMCGYLLIPDLRSLFDYFTQSRPYYATKRLRIWGAIAKVLFLGYLVISSGIGAFQGFSQIGTRAPKSPLYGIWDVEDFTRDGVSLPPLLTDTVRWRRFLTQRPDSFSVRLMDDSPRSYKAKFDTAKSTITGGNLSLTWSRPDAGHLLLSGAVDSHQVEVRMKNLDVSRSNLLGRGFHWVSELPFNR